MYNVLTVSHNDENPVDRQHHHADVLFIMQPCGIGRHFNRRTGLHTNDLCKFIVGVPRRT